VPSINPLVFSSLFFILLLFFFWEKFQRKNKPGKKIFFFTIILSIFFLSFLSIVSFHRSLFSNLYFLSFPRENILKIQVDIVEEKKKKRAGPRGRD